MSRSTTSPGLSAPNPSTPLQRKLTRQRVIAYGRICLIALAAIWLVWLLRADGLIVAGKPVGGDFVTFFAASDLALSGEAASVYDHDTIHAAETRALGADAGRFAWHYPPTFLLLVSGLAFLPYLGALALWLAATAAALLLSLRSRLRDEAVLLVSLAFPGVYQNLVTGQTGFLSGAVLAGGLMLMPARPLLGGAVLGLITYKPHFAPIVLVALLAARSRSALAGAAMSSLLLAALSWLAFGAETWVGFLENIPAASRLLYEGALPLGKMTSVSASLLMLGLPVVLVQSVQAVVVLAAAAFVFRVWRSGFSYDLQAGTLCFAVLLAAPFAFDYDTVILGIGLLFFYREVAATDWRRYEAEVFVFAWLSPFLLIFVGAFTGLGLFPILLVILLWMIWRRGHALSAHEEARQSPPVLTRS